MSSPQPSAVLTLWIVLPDDALSEPGPARLLEQLSRDPRYKIAAVIIAPRLGHVSGMMRSVLWFEHRFVPVRSRYVAAYRTAGKAVFPRLTIDAAHATDPAPDVIIDFSMGPAAASLAARARLGLWRLDAFHAVAGLEEAMRRLPVVTVSLYRTDGLDQHKIAQTGYDTKKLASHSQTYIREKSVQLIVQELARASQGQDLPVAAWSEPAAAEPGATALMQYVANSISFVCSRLVSRIRRKRGLMPNQFRLAIGTGDVMTFDPATVLETKPRGNTFWADPFLIEHGGTTWCFFEEYNYQRCSGQISVGRLTEGGIEYVGPALTTPFHASFPYVFRDGDEVYMIPETVANGRIEIYRATDFPTGWTLHATAMEGQRAADTTLTHYNGEWWLFTNIGHDGFGDNCNELCIFRTSGPDLAWMEPHALNPVVIGADRARNAGRLIERDGKLYRMAQDNSGGVYGFGLKVMEVATLNLADYSEQCVRHIKPDFRKGVIGCHHFDTNGTHFVMDVLRP